MYLPLEIALNTVKFLFTIILGCDLKPVFDEPYLATSLQDFWGPRWNPMVSSLLRSAFYFPLKGKSNSGLAMFIGGLRLSLPLVCFTNFNLLYTSYETPSWEITLFYVLHGVCTAAEMVVKRKATLVSSTKPFKAFISP
ncbi:probable long-chain-alcohol O-fatty-acyltransferase 9 [Raphanus sativus]|uniref:long-chain-alcohol O-fatty-acyltransferase n=1 Tax=Raphanus sativus TaxID=3726 RepID=A0A9W3DHF9_RAPSA|nr:probable long-chain-alcohol O-fatty-acyltransferase 9 [Raphanus sativus]